MKKSIFLILPAVMLMLASCMDSAGGNGGAGSVRVVLPGASRAVSSSDRADSYTVSLLKGGNIIESQTAVPGGAVEFDEVDAGSYTVKVWASKGGEICGVGKNSVEVSAGESAPCEIKMRTAYSASAAAEYIKTLGGDNYNVIVAGPVDDNAIAGIKAVLNINGTVALDLSWTTGLTEIAGVLGNGGAFEGCARLSSVVLPEGITAIWENSFAGCTSLASIEIPNSITTIGDDAFMGCEALAAVYYNGTKKQWLSLKSSSIENSSGNIMLIMSKIICSDGEISPEFVKINAVSITGNEAWTPESEVFVSGRKLEIKAFYMCDHEVTRGEYKKIIGSDPSPAIAYGTADNNPVSGVSWYDAIVYCNRRSTKEGLTPCYTINGSTNPDDWNNGNVPTSSDDAWNAATCDFTANGYRLPTEAEWEWAARGGENYTYAGSGNIDEVAWYIDNTNSTGTREVKTKKANGYKLYDMSGNVWEWCWDWYSDDILSDTSSGSRRCQRGGSWYAYGSYCEVADRESGDLYARVKGYGFRVVRSAQ